MRRVSRLLICIPQRRAGLAPLLGAGDAGGDALRAVEVVGLIRAVGGFPGIGSGVHKKPRLAGLGLLLCALGYSLCLALVEVLGRSSIAEIWPVDGLDFLAP